MAVKKTVSAWTLIIIGTLIGVLVFALDYYFKQPDKPDRAAAAELKSNFNLAISTVKSELAKAAAGGTATSDVAAVLNAGNQKSPINPDHPAFVATEQVRDDGQTMISPVDINKAYREGLPVTVTPARSLKKVDSGITQLSIDAKTGGEAQVLPPQS